MIGFELEPEQLALRDTARRYAREVVRPAAAQHDRDETFPREELKKAWELGLVNSLVPAALGGVQLPILSLCLLGEELFWGCAGLATSLTANDMALLPIVLAGTEAQQRRFIGPFLEEYRAGAFALTEPNAGSDMAGISTTAVKRGDHYVLNGTKQWITNAGEAELFTVFAKVDPKAGFRGMAAFVVEKGTAGLSVGARERKMGQRASDTRSVRFEDCAIPAANLLGAEGKGFELATSSLERIRPLTAAGAVGIGRAALEYATAYVMERRQFGKQIGTFQGLQFMLADLAQLLAASRLLTWQAACRVDGGDPSPMASSMAKCFATDAAMRITTDAVQLFGGYGYSCEYPVEKLMRDAKLMQIYEGTNQIQRSVIAVNLLTGKAV